MQNLPDETQPVVLSYANPLAAQPVGGRLTLVRDKHGITLADSKSISTSPDLIRWVGLALLAGGCGAFVAFLIIHAREHDAEVWSHISAALISIACGLVCVVRAKRVKSVYPQVRLERDQLTADYKLELKWMASRLRVKKFKVAVGSIDLLTGKRLCSVDVSFHPGIRCRLFANLLADEARWAVHELELERCGGESV